jgi:hypothetical protein
VDLAASVVTAAATLALAVLAVVQIRASQTQAADAKAQSDAAVAAAEAQSKSALEIAREAREAAQRQWQPRVSMHAWPGPERGDGTHAAPDEMAVRFYLSNEGTGPAFNVNPWVEAADKRHTWKDRYYRTMRVDEFCPPLTPGTGQPVPTNRCEAN